MHRITKRFYFEAAHRLQKHLGACRNLHGHSYKLEVTVVALDLNEDGPAKDMLMDFGQLSKIVKGILFEGEWKGITGGIPFDHSTMLNVDDPLYSLLDHHKDMFGFRLIGMTFEPTAEYMAELFGNMIQESLEYHGIKGVNVDSIKVWETRDSVAESVFRCRWKVEDDDEACECEHPLDGDVEIDNESPVDEIPFGAADDDEQ